MIAMLLDAYRTEYETTDITLDDLLKKYSLTKAKLKGCSKWQKLTPTIDTQLPLIDLVEEPPIPTYTVVLPTPAQTTDMLDSRSQLPTTVADLTTIEKINKFKEAAVDRALKFINEEAQFAEVKEFKDIVAIVDSIEKSYQKVDPDAGKPTINIMINNLIERFNDDC